ncbi:MAG: SDR family NAD(P)-dependent oxidoreductase [Rhodobacteraceae bacterium]|nr:SDR family NAD(P)-dependent oxidoreductase [Paracoccaceae bacterium]
MRIEGHVAFITGGASGLGGATAAHLAAAGARVAVLDLPGPRLEEARAAGHLALAADVRDDAALEEAMAQCVSELGAPRIVVNCAGVATGARILNRAGEIDIASFRRTVEINLIGSFAVMSLAVRHMARLDPVEGGERGVILNTASIAATDGQVGQCAYSASKAGVSGLTLPAARELGRLGIRVVTIAPGLFETPMMAGLPEDVQERLATLPPFPHRLGRAAEYAALAVHVVENQMLNGTTLRLDGAVRLEPR